MIKAKASYSWQLNIALTEPDFPAIEALAEHINHVHITLHALQYTYYWDVFEILSIKMD